MRSRRPADDREPGTATVVPAGFFVLRTPLLPLDEFLTLGAGLGAPAAVADHASLEPALRSDASLVRERLRALLARPEVDETIRLASPSLHAAVPEWAGSPETRSGQRTEHSLVRYLARMTTRPTPLGLLAGWSTGLVETNTRIELAELKRARRVTRLDTDYLHALAASVARHPEMRSRLHYSPNPSMYRAGGRLRYVQSRGDGDEGTHRLVGVAETPLLMATLGRASEGAALAALVDAVVAHGVEIARARRYVEDLIDGQLLVPELQLSVMGPEPVDDLIEQLRRHIGAHPLADALDGLVRELAALDAAGLGLDPRRYDRLARRLDEMPVTAGGSRRWQVDLCKPARRASLGPAVLEEIARGVAVLWRLGAPTAADTSDLSRFTQQFAARYGDREIPLVEALDPDIGIGFPVGAQETVGAPLIAGLPFRSQPTNRLPWGGREQYLLDRLNSRASGEQDLILEDVDVRALAVKSPPALPDAFGVKAAIGASSAAALDAGDFEVLVLGVKGPSGAGWLGRLSQVDEELRRHLRNLFDREASCAPDAILAEIALLPEGSVANLVHRPRLRSHEIRYADPVGDGSDGAIPVTDLIVALENGVGGPQIVLRSARLGRRVLPRLASAHDYRRATGAYRFLCELQGASASSLLHFDWGPALKLRPFLPRVRSGRVVLSPAQWRLSRPDLERLGVADRHERFMAVQSWRAARRLPRLVELVDAGTTLAMDLDNVLSVESFVDLVRQRESATLIELWPDPERVAAHGPEGRFRHDVIVPFVRQREFAVPKATIGAPGTRTSARGPRRTYPPGSEWLYAKLYASPAEADRILTDVVAPLAADTMASGAADRWFFVRYTDPDWHLRLRFHGAAGSLNDQVLPALQAAAAGLLEDGRAWRLTLDTYEREVERYGGQRAVNLAESVFHVDSEAVLEILQTVGVGDRAADQRWRAALIAAHRLLEDLAGAGDEARRSLIARRRAALGREFQVDGTFTRELARRFRRERRQLVAVLDDPHNSAAAAVDDILRSRSERLAPIVAELRELQSGGELHVGLDDLALTHVHMQLNRLLRCAHRAQELVLYDFLARIEQSRAARTAAHLTLPARP